MSEVWFYSGVQLFSVHLTCFVSKWWWRGQSGPSDRSSHWNAPLKEITPGQVRAGRTTDLSLEHGSMAGLLEDHKAHFFQFKYHKFFALLTAFSFVSQICTRFIVCQWSSEFSGKSSETAAWQWVFLCQNGRILKPGHNGRRQATKCPVHDQCPPARAGATPLSNIHGFFVEIVWTTKRFRNSCMLQPIFRFFPSSIALMLLLFKGFSNNAQETEIVCFLRRMKLLSSYCFAYVDSMKIPMGNSRLNCPCILPS